MHARTQSVNRPLISWEPQWWRQAMEAAMQFDPKVDLGQIGVILALAGGLSYWAITSAGTAKVASDAAKQASDAVAALRGDMNDQFRQVRADIANLPDVRAELIQIERRLDQNDSRADALSKRTELLEREVIQTRADLDAALRARK